MSIRFDKLQPSASIEVTKMAKELRRLGEKVYTLSIGDTHFPPPQRITSKLSELPEAYSHYSDSNGIAELNKQIASKEGFNSENVLLVPGLKQGFYYALGALEKKKLCVLEPAWLGYKALATLTGYEYSSINTYQDGWQEKLLKTSFDILIICSPNNPDGKVLSREDMELVKRAANNNSAWVLADCIYSRFCYSNSYDSFYNSLLEYEHLIVGNGFSKSHAMTGFRIGYLLLKNSSIFQKMLILQQNMATCVSSIAQYLMVGFESADPEVDSYRKYYNRNKNMVLEVFPEWKQFEPQGAFYYFIDLSVYGITDSLEFTKQLLQETGIALVPGGAYGEGFESFVRLSFSVDFEYLKEALYKLKGYLNQ